MEKKFINKVKIGFDSAEGSDKLACSLIIVCENEKELACDASCALDALIYRHGPFLHHYRHDHCQFRS